MGCCALELRSWRRVQFFWKYSKIILKKSISQNPSSELLELSIPKGKKTTTKNCSVDLQEYPNLHLPFGFQSTERFLLPPPDLGVLLNPTLVRFHHDFHSLLIWRRGADRRTPHAAHGASNPGNEKQATVKFDWRIRPRSAECPDPRAAWWMCSLCPSSCLLDLSTCWG